MATPVKWNEELREQVREMWNDKRMSAAQIGAEFNVSRCAIISLIHRMGLDGFRGASADERATLRAVRLQRDRARQASKAARQLKGDVAPKVAKTKAPEERVMAPTIEMLNIPFSERRRNQCKLDSGRTRRRRHLLRPRCSRRQGLVRSPSCDGVRAARAAGCCVKQAPQPHHHPLRRTEGGVMSASIRAQYQKFKRQHDDAPLHSGLRRYLQAEMRKLVLADLKLSLKGSRKRRAA